MSKKKEKNDLSAEPRSPRGMRDIWGEEYYSYQGFYEKAAEICLYYGYRPIATPTLEQASLFERSIGEGSDIIEKEIYVLKTKGGDRLALRPEGTAPVMRAYFERGMLSEPQPVMLYYCGPFYRHDKPQAGRYREFRQFGLEVIGTSKSIADALTIWITQLILKEAGVQNLRVDINSIGDKDCRPNYLRQLTTYYKKHARSLCADCRERLKTNPLRLLDCKDEKCQSLKEDAPCAVEYLCAACKDHLREVLEYLDSLGLDYNLNHQLVRGLDYYTRTVFEISQLAPPKSTPENAGDDKAAAQPAAAPLSLAAGGRYDGLAKAIGQKKGVPAVGSAIGVDRVLGLPEVGKLTPRIIKKPKIFFIQLGFEAKLKSLTVIEILRQAKIPMVQALPRDSLAAQLAIAEKLGVPYVIILGQREVVDGTVIVRNMQNRSQDTIKIEDLSRKIKELK